MNEDLLFAILKICKENNITIEKPYRFQDGDGGKIGDPATHQFSIMKEYKSEKYWSGLSGYTVDLKFDLSKEQAINNLIDKLAQVAKNSKLQFIGLVLPHKCVEFSEMIDCHDVIIRHLIDYLPTSEILADRWDILIKVS